MSRSAPLGSAPQRALVTCAKFFLFFYFSFSHHFSFFFFIARVSIVQPVMCSDLFAEQAIIYKEKVNYKLPGGAGFAPHQDVAAGWWMVRAQHKHSRSAARSSLMIALRSGPH